MRKMMILDRALLLVTGILAGYQVAAGIEGLDGYVILFFTVGVGVFLGFGCVTPQFRSSIWEYPTLKIAPISQALEMPLPNRHPPV